MQRQPTEEFCVYVLYCAVNAIQELHRKNVIHRNVQARNIFCDIEDQKVKMFDLGKSMFLTQEESFRHSMLESGYPAPETTTENPQYNHKADIWSLGILAYELAKGHIPRSRYSTDSNCFRVTDRMSADY